MEVGAVALKEWMRAERQKNIEVAGWPPAEPRLAFPGQPDARAVFDARRDIHRQSALARHPARSDTRRARAFDHLAPALTSQAGALEREETLGMTDFAEAAAARNGDWRLSAGKRFLQRDFQVVAQIRAALASRAAPAAAAHTEQIIEDVG